MDGEKTAESRRNYAPYFGFVVSFSSLPLMLLFFIIPLLCALLMSLKKCQFDSRRTQM